MARGWESKSVESQIEDREAARAHAPTMTPEQLKRNREREGLQLSRTRVLHDLEKAVHPRYRQQLEAALHHLEEKIAALTE